MAKEAKEKDKQARKAKKAGRTGAGASAKDAEPTPKKKAAEADAEAERAERSVDDAVDNGGDDGGDNGGDDGGEGGDEGGESEALAVRSGEAAAIDRDEAPDESQSMVLRTSDDAVDGEEVDDEPAAASLGTERYVLAGFFGAAILGAYVFGRVVHGVWTTLANKDWFVQNLPRLAGVADDDKSTYGTILGAVIAIIAVIRIYRKPEVRTWSDEVATELTKVKWPTKKEVTSSTMVVIAASTVATIYLMLLDRLWAFITNLVYGTGS